MGDFKMKDDLIIREANENDAELIFDFINEMAKYEKSQDKLSTNIEAVKNTICNGKYAKGIIAEYDKQPVAYAVYLYNYSTYLGKPGIYLEDLYVMPEHRGKGFGKTMLSFIAKTAIENGCGRFEWSCLDWNEDSIRFYLSLGAQSQDERTTYRLSGINLQNMANIK
jgi:GNAT superfamily N-acetyltransferase